MSTLAQQILAASALLGAVAVIFKVLHLPEIGKGLLVIVRDWRGDPPRPGYEGRPSIPERMANVESRTAALNHDMRDDLGGRMSLLEQQLDAVVDATKQLKRNGGSHLADQVHNIATTLGALSDQADRLEGYASANREGIARLDQRVTDVQEETTDLGQRVTDHRRRNDETITALRDWLEGEYRDSLVARQALEASVSELLMVDGHEQRDQPHRAGLRPDEQPDL